MPTQAQRSAATREKAIDATIECLVERGYAGATIAAVAARAGISRGALSHQYPDKQRLVIDTIDEISARLTRDLSEQIAHIPPGRARLEQGLDQAWAAFTGPVFAAALEAYVAARTDAVLAPRIAVLAAEVEERLLEVLRVMVDAPPSPELDGRAGVLLNTLRGLGLLWAIGAPRPDLERLWRRVRADALDTFGAGPSGSTVRRDRPIPALSPIAPPPASD